MDCGLRFTVIMLPTKKEGDKKERLDKLLVDKGLAATRQQAQGLILAGRVKVEGQRVDKPGSSVAAEAALEVEAPQYPYVSRGGVKLKAALDHFGISVKEKTCLDVGASTGGFTHCLLLEGAQKVYTLDVGKGQLDWQLRRDPRVVNIEGVNIRQLTSADLPELFSFISIDVSFISLKLVLPVAYRLLLAGGESVALIKPQFEVGKGQVQKGGLVKDPQLHQQVIEEISHFCQSLGFKVHGVIESPIIGGKGGQRGNKEFLIYLAKK